MFHFMMLLADQAAIPHIDGMYVFMLLARISHIVGAIILVGGQFYIRFVLTPPNVQAGDTSADRIFGGHRTAWARCTGGATALILIAGIINYMLIIKQHERFDASYHMLMGFKILAATGAFLLAALLAGRTAVADRIRQKWRMWLIVCLLLGFIAVALGSVLRTYPHIRRADAGGPPQLVAPANPMPK